MTCKEVFVKVDEILLNSSKPSIEIKKLIDEAKQKEKEYTDIKDIQDNSKQDDSENIKKTINEFLELKEPTPEIMKVIINRIEIHQDKQVDLFFNFKQLNH